MKAGDKCQLCGQVIVANKKGTGFYCPGSWKGAHLEILKKFDPYELDRLLTEAGYKKDDREKECLIKNRSVAFSYAKDLAVARGGVSRIEDLGFDADLILKYILNEKKDDGYNSLAIDDGTELPGDK